MSKRTEVTIHRGSLFAAGPPAKGERSDTLFEGRAVRIEEISSSSTPAPVVYNQDHPEWVVLLKGEAQLRMNDETVVLKAGEWLFIPARVPHQVLSTATGSVWLAVHLPVDEIPAKREENGV